MADGAPEPARPLRLAVIGGGPGSFIGAMHRTAARLDGRYQLVAGVVSSDPERSKDAATRMGIDPARAYSDAMAMLDAEQEREDGAEVVAIMTPNDTHHLYAVAALDRGFDVICDKPMTNTLDEALDIVRKVGSTGLVFCLTHVYTGYPMVRQARAMVEDGQVGEIRLVQVEYVQGGKADESDPDPASGLPWRYDPVRGVRFVTRREVTEVAAEIGHVIPERPVDDYGAAMLRFDNGARGSFWVTQTAAGVENSLGFRLSGTKGSLEWHQERPTRLIFKPLQGPVRVYTPNGPGTLPASARACRIAAGHPEGFHEAFANLYSDAAEVIAARRSGSQPDPLALEFPNERDGAIGVKFVEAAVASSRANGAWTDARLALEAEV
ncbi:MAG: Gfo/Idh/MocA family oxidoreductase [Chloroflexi bacterium]|nr:MAG: Gfo/Idh/MocA family oxidoreductase [Chloroflexota bacterium]